MTLRYSIFALGLWFLAALLCAPIEKGLSQATLGSSPDSPLYRILGSATEAVGDVLFLKADSYFHGGVTEKFHEEGENMMTMKPGEVEKDGEEAPSDWIAKINRQVTSHAHRHLSADKIRELLPFFALSTTLDPHNIEALLTTAFWLDKSFSKADEAIRVLEKGVTENPASWELESELGRLYLQRKNDPASSQAHYLAAIRKSSRLEVEMFRRLDLYYFLAQACELEGKRAEALTTYREALKFFDGKRSPALREKILKRIEALSV